MAAGDLARPETRVCHKCYERLRSAGAERYTSNATMKGLLLAFVEWLEDRKVPDVNEAPVHLDSAGSG